MPSKDDRELRSLKARKRRFEDELKEQAKTKQRLEEILAEFKSQGVSSAGSKRIERTIARIERQMAANEEMVNLLIGQIRRYQLRVS